MTRHAATAEEAEVLLEVAGEVVRDPATGRGRASLRVGHTDFDAPEQRIGSVPGTAI